jgi:predicted lipid-binding transport protein (Tim44 family)
MGDNFQILEILVFAVIAVVLVFRLRAVLGRRTGTERRRDGLSPRSAQPAPPPTVAPPARAEAPIALPSRPRLVAAAGAELGDPAVAQLLSADPGFNRDAFLDGARAAFAIVVQAFAEGDRAKLQPLLSPEVFKSFGDAIAVRERAGEKQETKLVAIKSADIESVQLEGDTAMVTVKFVSQQMLATRGRDGAVVEGDPDRTIDQTDLWTFARAIRSRDPNWTLIATHTTEK